MLGPIAFTAPGLLLGLIALPILWLLLRAIPPAPLRRRFPGVALLLGLQDEDRQAEQPGHVRAHAGERATSSQTSSHSTRAPGNRLPATNRSLASC